MLLDRTAKVLALICFDIVVIYCIVAYIMLLIHSGKNVCRWSNSSIAVRPLFNGCILLTKDMGKWITWIYCNWRTNKKERTKSYIGYAACYQLVVGSLVPSRYLNQCWLIVNWTLRKTRQWKFKTNCNKCSFKNIYWKLSFFTDSLYYCGQEMSPHFLILYLLFRPRDGWWFTYFMA